MFVLYKTTEFFPTGYPFSVNWSMLLMEVYKLMGKRLQTEDCLIVDEYFGR
jgi:hypothetical protein